MTRAPLVDVAIVTYNHEKYVAQAIESVLAQQTDFAYRLIIGDDCSTDNTQAIIRSYAEKYPGRIVMSFEPKNIGIRHRDRVGIKILKLCTAKYIAMLDGDDFWTDPRKLQKQADYLEARPDFSTCFHNATIFYEDGAEISRLMCPPGQKEVSTLEDILRSNFIPTCSVMFRNGLFGELPEWYYTSTMGDWPIHVFNAQHGNIGYLNETMATYRVHGGGRWSLQDRAFQLNESIRVIDELHAYLGFKYKQTVEKTKARWYDELAGVYFQQGDLSSARRSVAQAFKHNPFELRRLKTFLMLSTPSLYKQVKTLKSFIRSAMSG